MADEPVLHEGDNDQGEAGWVAYLQGLLDASGHSPGRIDGWFGPITRGAVEAFQQANQCTVDGWVGPQTWGALNALGLTPTPPPEGHDASAEGGEAQGSGDVPEDVVALGFPATSDQWSDEQREGFFKGGEDQEEQEAGSAEDVELLAIQDTGNEGGEELA